ncbi:carbohydrate porin, partial [Cupriavidus basilensis]
AETPPPADGNGAEAPVSEEFALVSQLPADDPAGDQVWRLSYSGRAAYEDRTTTMRACAGGGTLSTGIGGGLACRSSGEVKLNESLFALDGGGQVQLVAQAKGTDATSVNGRPAAVDPYALLPQIYTAVSGLSVLDGATMWAGRRENSSFLMSSGLLPPTSPAMRFGVDNARFGDIALNYQYTARNDLDGANLPSYHSLRTAPISTNDKGSVQLGYTRVEAQPLVQQTGSAWWVSAMHEQKDVLAGINRFGMQYGEGSRNALTGYTGMGPALSRIRVAESMEWKKPSGLGLAGAVESSMQFDRSSVGTLQWVATRVRPAYIASDQFKLSFEVAHDQISSGFGASGQRTAFTIAPTITLGKAAGNANLRAFYTYSRANDVDGIAFATPVDTWASQTSGSIFGVQLNRRW